MSPSTLPRVPLLAALVLLAVAACGSGDARTQTAAAPGTGYVGHVDGFDLSAQRGRVVLLNFWATWCGPCRVEIPDLVRLRRDFRAEDLSIVGISLDAHGPREQIEGQLRQFIDKYEVNYPVYLDAEQELAGTFSGGFMNAVPTTIVIDRNGKVRGMHSGLPRGSDGRVDPYGVLARQVQALLDEG